MRKIGLLGVGMFLCLTGCNNAGDSGGGGSSVGASRAVTTSDFRRKANQLQPGTPKNEVLKVLGKPDERRLGVAGVPREGAQPPVTVNSGSRYEEWLYVRGDSVYHVFLGPSATNPGQWEVHSVSANPKEAVAH